MLDFAETDRYDSRALLREEWLLNEAEGRMMIAVRELAYMWHCSAAQLVEWDREEKHFNYHLNNAKEQYRLIGKVRLPWYDAFWRGPAVPLEDVWARHLARWNDPQIRPQLQALQARLDKKSADAEQQARNKAEWEVQVREARRRRSAQGRRKR